MESVFTFLFKYRPILYQQGDFAFGASWPVATVLGVAGLAALVAILSYGGGPFPGRGMLRGSAPRTGALLGGGAGSAGRRRAGAGDRLVMAGLRAGTLGVLLFCLFRPTLVLTSVVPQRNFVGVLVDDSRSMTLPGEDGEPRSAFVAEALGAESELLEELSERFAVRMFRFGSDASRVASAGELTFDDTRTDLATALDRAREELSSVPLSGLVVLTDGADNAGRGLTESLVPLQASSVPVYTVGVGGEVVSPDIQVGQVRMPRRVLRGSALVVDVVLAQRGFGGETVPLLVEDDTRILAEEDVTLEGDGEPTVVRVRFTLEDAGPRRVRFSVPAREGERVERNNQREILVEVQGEREKVLYFEGELREEGKFALRAVEDDPNLQVVYLARTAENKFYRRNVDSGEELQGGFPKTREELFQYRGLVLGSVEASFFTHDQLDMIAEFVSRRGGGLLVLGGRLALAEGDYAGTPVAEALPVHLEEPVRDRSAAFTELRVRPTPAGAGHPATQIRPGADPDALWDSLPPINAINRIERLKPGATSLLAGETASGEERVVLAHQRYGRGRVLVFPVMDSWLWQMHADVPLEDPTHENLWRQLLRWTIDGVPEPVELRPERERAEPGDPVRLIAEVHDSAYIAVNDARVLATVVAPDGTEEEIRLEWTVERDGEYAATFTPTVPGEYRIAAEATRGEEAMGMASARVRVGPSDEEYFDAAQRRPLLQRIAEQTGGRYYTPATVASLPEDIQYTGGGVTLTEERDLWDMPFLFLLLVGLVGTEWGFRKKRGLV